MLDFVGEHEIELSFKEGDELHILDVPAPDGWLMARNAGGGQGLLPESYMRLKAAAGGEADPPSSESQKLNRLSQPALAGAPAFHEPPIPESSRSRNSNAIPDSSRSGCSNGSHGSKSFTSSSHEPVPPGGRGRASLRRGSSAAASLAAMRRGTG